MGHDVTARGKKTNKEVYLRMNIRDGILISHFYNALDAEYYNGGVSGIGEGKEYTEEEMKKARDKYLYYKEEYLEPDERGVELIKEMITQVLSSNADIIVIGNEKEEIEVDFKRLDNFFNESQGEDFVIFFE